MIGRVVWGMPHIKFIWKSSVVRLTHCAVFPVERSWIRRNTPFRVVVNVAVIMHLSSSPITSILAVPLSQESNFHMAPN